MCLDKNLLIASSLLYFLGNRPYDTKVLQNKKKKKKKMLVKGVVRYTTFIENRLVH